jgi:eukaryotic-like serine/threonine-protein kinase
MARPVADRLIAGRYALGISLGRGGMGIVWRAHDSVLDREVAVREVVFPPTMAEEERRLAEARVLREARAAARLDHPGVVALYDVVQDQGGIFIVTELVDAPTLAEVVRDQGPLPLVRVAEIGDQLASGLEVAHRAGIVHGDVKPTNVVVPAAGPAKLADFGISSLARDPQLISAGLMIGSPAYMAPEQARGEASGPPADFWAVGATMFYAVEGEPPFDRGGSIATLAAVVNEDPRPMHRAGPLAPLLMALLAKDPRNRASGPELRAEVAHLVAARPASLTEVLPSKRTSRTVPLQGTPQPSTPEPAGTPASPHPSTASANVSQRSQGAPAFEPTPSPAWELPPETAPVQRPSRPVLPPAPPVPRRDRRQLAGILALLLTALLVAWLAGNIGADPGEGRAASATAGRSAGVDLDEEQAAPATTRGAVGATGTTQPIPSTTKEPATIQVPRNPTTRAPRTPTTRAPTTLTTAAAQGQLPAGWRPFTNQAGNNRVGVPPGFQARTRQRYHATVLEEHGGGRRVFTVRSQTPSAPLPQASRDYRAWARRNFPGFREVRYAEDQTYAGHRPAVLFEYQAVRDGRRVHVRHINVKGRTWGYNVEFIVPADQWDASRELARRFEQAFQPLG